MNLQKSELKTALIREFSDKTQGLGVDANDELIKLEGAMGAFQLAARTLERNREFYRKQLLDEELSQEQYKLVMTVMDRDIGALQSLHATTQVEKQRKEGEVAAYKRMAELLSREHEAEISKVRNFKEAVQSGTVQMEGDGTSRPQGLSAVEDLALRREEAKKAKEAALATTQETLQEVGDVETPAPKAKAAKKKKEPKKGAAKRPSKASLTVSAERR